MSEQRIILCVITFLVMMPLCVHSQEEYTCDWIFNSIPQTGLKTEIFEILGEPDEKVIFDKEGSDKDSYYFYLMSKVMHSQDVG